MNYIVKYSIYGENHTRTFKEDPAEWILNMKLVDPLDPNLFTLIEVLSRNN